MKLGKFKINQNKFIQGESTQKILIKVKLYTDKNRVRDIKNKNKRTEQKFTN